MSSWKNKPPHNIARFAGFFIQTILSGIYWVNFYNYLDGARKRSKLRQEALWKTPMFVVGCLLFLLDTGEYIVLALSSFKAFINCATTDTPFDERGYLSLSKNWSFAYNAFYIAVPVVADSFLIYRLFIVWSRNWWIIIPPAAFCVGLVVTASITAKIFIASVDSIFSTTRYWLLASFSLTFACNVYCTFLIGLRIGLASQHAGQVTPSRLQKSVNILIQSAALYCLLVALSLMFSIMESNALYFSVGATSSVVGICFCMIVTRANIDSDKKAVQHNSWPHNGISSNTAPLRTQTHPNPPPPPSRPPPIIQRSATVQPPPTVQRPPLQTFLGRCPVIGKIVPGTPDAPLPAGYQPAANTVTCLVEKVSMVDRNSDSDLSS